MTPETRDRAKATATATKRFDAVWSEASLRTIWESLAEGLRVTDEAGTIIRVNPAYCRMVGLTREQLEGKHFTSCYRDETHSELVPVHEECLRSRTAIIRMEWDVLCLDGRRLCLEASYSMAGEPDAPSVLTMFRDITPRRVAQEQLRKSEEKYRSLVETTPDWIWEMDLEGRLTYSNASVHRMLGYPPEEVIGQRMAMLLVPEDGRLIQESLGGGAAAKPGWRGCTLRWFHKEGTWRYSKSYAAPILDAEGVITGYRGVDHDITEQRILMQHCDQAQKLESIGRLAGGIAHDFNNLLTVILGYADRMLGELYSSDPLYESVAEIRKAGQRATELTRQLLMFGRRQAIQPEMLDLNSIIADTERMLRRVIGEDIALSTYLCPDLDLVLVDPGQITQVLVNLAVNARDAMPKGGEIFIGTERVHVAETAALMGDASIPPGGYVLLTFSDTGVGMDAHVQSRVFEPFFTTKQPDQGTGLGLSTVYGIVKRAGGHIRVYSEVGKGSTFKVYLPAAQPVATPALAPATAVGMGGTETVLLVEDQEEVRVYLADSLRTLGYTVLATSGPEECIRLLQHYEGTIDLVLTDVVMPGMSGTQLAKKIAEQRPALKAVVFMSGYAEDLITRKENLKPGACYLSKPFTTQMLATKIRQALAGKQRRTVLVADDDGDVREFLVAVLRGYGYDVVEAANGVEAIDALKRQAVDLMVSDLAMPERDGIETIQFARHLHTGIKIVSISGRYAEDILKASRLLGADRALRKPVSAQLLLETTWELLGD